MRNLRNLRFGRWRHPDLTAACWDPENDEIVCSIGPTAQNQTIELVRVSDKDSMCVFANICCFVRLKAGAGQQLLLLDVLALILSLQRISDYTHGKRENEEEAPKLT
jgi:hypothetical protein